MVTKILLSTPKSLIIKYTLFLLSALRVPSPPLKYLLKGTKGDGEEERGNPATPKALQPPSIFDNPKYFTLL